MIKRSIFSLALSLLLVLSLWNCKKDDSTTDEDNYTTIWREDFESYEINKFPSTWIKDGNASDVSNNYVTDVTSSEGSKSLKLYGTLGGCWGSLPLRALETIPPYIIKLDVRNGTESLSGCHQDRAAIVLRKGTSWTNPGRALVYFKGDGYIYLGAEKSDKYTTNVWYTVKIKYEKLSSTQVKISYWINNVFKGDYTITSLSNEDQFTNLEIAVEEGTAWFDNISVLK